MITLAPLAFTLFITPWMELLAEIVGIALHSQAVDAYHNFLFLTCGVVILSRIAVISSHFQHLVGCYEILTGPVALHYSRHHVLCGTSA